MTLGFSPLGSAPLAGDEGVLSAAAAYIATGISASAAFGVPSASAAASVAGFSSTQAGTPTAVMAGVYIAAGIAPTTAVGTPTTPTTASNVTGVQSAYARATLIGKPSRLVYNYAPSASQWARVGSPKAVTTRYTCVVGGIAPITAIGSASSSSVLRAKVGSIYASQIGVPSARFTQFGLVSGFKPTRFGQPRVPPAPFDLSLHVVKRERRLYARVS